MREALGDGLAGGSSAAGEPGPHAQQPKGRKGQDVLSARGGLLGPRLFLGGYKILLTMRGVARPMAGVCAVLFQSAKMGPAHLRGAGIGSAAAVAEASVREARVEGGRQVLRVLLRVICAAVRRAAGRIACALWPQGAGTIQPPGPRVPQHAESQQIARRRLSLQRLRRRLRRRHSPSRASAHSASGGGGGALPNQE